MPDWVQIKFDTNDVAQPPFIESASTGNPNGKYIHEKDYEHVAKQAGERSVNLTQIGIKIHTLQYMIDDGDDKGAAIKMQEIKDLTRHYLPSNYEGWKEERRLTPEE